MNHIDSSYREYRHIQEKLRHHKTTMPYVDYQVNVFLYLSKLSDKMLAQDGELVMGLLDEWEAAGATFNDLCGLIGRNRAAIMSRMRKSTPGERLSKLVCACGLDYHDNGSDWYEHTQDGPFTHASKEYLIEQIENTEEGRKAAHIAMQECFPDVWEKRVYLSTDCEGNQILIDRNGETIGYLNQEGAE